MIKCILVLSHEVVSFLTMCATSFIITEELLLIVIQNWKVYFSRIIHHSFNFAYFLVKKNIGAMKWVSVPLSVMSLHVSWVSIQLWVMSLYGTDKIFFLGTWSSSMFRSSVTNNCYAAISFANVHLFKDVACYLFCADALILKWPCNI